MTKDMHATARPTTHWGWTFFPIWIGQALSWIGSTVAQFALVWWLTDLTGSAAVLAAATTVAMLPQIILGPLAGTYVDRWNRRMTMIIADGFIALISLWLAWLFWSGNLEIWHIYVVLTMRALGGIFHRPAIQASTAMLVPKKELPRVHGLDQAMGGAVNVVGPLLGALALALLALHQVMFIDVITAVLAIVPLLFVRIPEPQCSAPSVGAPSVWGEMFAGFRYIRDFPGMMPIIVWAVLLNFMGAPTWTLLPLYIRNVFGGGAAELSFVQSGFGIGLIAGGLLLSVWGGFQSRVKTAFLGFLLSGFATLVVGGAPATALWAVAVAWSAFALFNAIGNGTLIALLQAAVAQNMQGRVMSAVMSAVTVATPLGLILSAPVVEAVGLRFWYLAAGVALILGSIWALVSQRVRRLDDVAVRLAETEAQEQADAEAVSSSPSLV